MYDDNMGVKKELDVWAYKVEDLIEVEEPHEEAHYYYAQAPYLHAITLVLSIFIVIISICNIIKLKKNKIFSYLAIVISIAMDLLSKYALSKNYVTGHALVHPMEFLASDYQTSKLIIAFIVNIICFVILLGISIILKKNKKEEFNNE